MLSSEDNGDPQTYFAHPAVPRPVDSLTGHRESCIDRTIKDEIPNAEETRSYNAIFFRRLFHGNIVAGHPRSARRTEKCVSRALEKFQSVETDNADVSLRTYVEFA